MESSLGIKGLLESFSIDGPAWQAWINSHTPQSDPLPASWSTQLTPFQRLLILKVPFFPAFVRNLKKSCHTISRYGA